MQLFLFLQNQHPSCPHQYQSGIDGLGFLFALPIMPSKFLCAPFRLDCHTILAYPYTGTHGSFQRDSAVAGHSCRRFRLHDRRAPLPIPQGNGCFNPWGKRLSAVSSLAIGAHCLMPVKGDVAAWRARPSGPDVWADALVRRMYPGKRRGLGGKRKSEAGARGYTLPHSHCRIIVGFASHFCGRYFLIFLR